MEKAMLLVVSSAKEGRDAEFNRWCNEQHLGDVVGCDGFTRGTRFKVMAEMGNAEVPGQYVTLYEMESDDIERDYALANAKRARGEMPTSDTIGPTISVTLLRPIKTIEK